MYTCSTFNPQEGNFSRKVITMSAYLVQISYTAEALAALIATKQNRTEVVKKVVKKLGGKVIGSWLAFGDYDIVLIIDMPDNVSAAALALAAAGGGSLKTVKTTPLLSTEEALAALEKAGTSGYKPVETAK
jgi:uncharacterized protein with GYD domain